MRTLHAVLSRKSIPTPKEDAVIGVKAPLDSRLLTVTEAADFLGVAKGTIYHWCCRLKFTADPIPTRRLSSRCLRFPADELKAWADRRGGRRNGANTDKGRGL